MANFGKFKSHFYEFDRSSKIAARIDQKTQDFAL